MLQTLRSKSIVAAGIVAAMVLGVAGVGIFSLNASVDHLQDIGKKFSNQVEVVAPLVHSSRDVQLSVIQVQQWFSDVSATRGLDGLDDGFDEAAKNAKIFEEAMKAALGHAKTLNMTDVATALQKVDEAFPAYYQTGLKMAQAYVAEGPSAGNKLMSNFDQTAETLSASIEKMLEEVRNVEERNRSTVSETITSASEMEKAAMISMIIVGVVAIVFVSVVSVMAVRSFAAIHRVSMHLAEAARGGLGDRISNITRNDEIGHLETDFNRLLDRVECFTRDVGGALKAVKDGLFYRDMLTGGFERSFLRRAEIINDGIAAMGANTVSVREHTQSMGDGIQSVIHSVSATAEQLKASSGSMANVADTTSQQSATVAAAAQDASENVEGVAAATEEFTASIRAVAEQVERSAELGRTAVSRADHADHTIQTLSVAADKIGQVVSLINDIAAQTNLLALNATIEAARAGEAGKGFAVVASEVKNLANQTARATDEIVQQIQTMQSATTDAVHAIEEVSTTINEIDQTGGVISDTIAQQRDAVEEISVQIQNSVKSVHIVAENIRIVADGATETSSASVQIGTAAQELAVRAANLDTDVSAFVRKILEDPAKNYTDPLGLA